MRPAGRWFIWFAPVTVPAYLVYLAVMSSIACCYYVAIEQTLEPILRHFAGSATAGLTRLPTWLRIVIAIGLMPVAVVAHVLVWLVHQLGRLFVALGRWQAAPRSGVAAGVLGFVWLAGATWAILTCIDPSAGWALVGRSVPGAAEYERAFRQRTTLGQLPPALQARRTALTQSYASGVNANLAGARIHASNLAHDELEMRELRFHARHFLMGVPWYYRAAFESEDGMAHNEMFVGSLLLVLLLLVRWPGMHRRQGWLPIGLFVVRMGVVVGTVAHALTWVPLDLNPQPLPVGSAQILWPATWVGIDPLGYLAPWSPEWLPLNVALWLLLAGLAIIVWTLAWALRPLLGPPGYYTSLLAVRLLQRKRIAFFSVGAVTLCVAMELIVISVMGGFLDTIRERSHAMLGDLVVDAGLTGFPYYQEFIDEIKKMPEVAQATPVVHSYGVLKFQTTGKVKAVEVRGIRLDEYKKVNSLGSEEGLFYTRYFPGTTTFAAASQPVYGYDADDKPVLPGPFESAWRAALAAQPASRRAEWLEHWPRVKHAPYTGPGAFELGPEFKADMVGRALPGIILGRDLIAQRLESGEYGRSEWYPRGMLCQLSLLPLSRGGRIEDMSAPPAPWFRYVDDARTGVYEFDSRTVFVDFAYLQDLLSLTPQQRTAERGGGMTPARCTSIQIKLAPKLNVLEWKSRIQRAWDQFAQEQNPDAEDSQAMRNVLVSTWEELQQSFIAAIQKEKVLTVIMFGIISVVAVLLVLCIFYMIVVEKTRDIGIIKSVGGSAQGVAAAFLTYGAAIGVVGAVVGSLIGYVFVNHINEFQDWLARLNPEWRVWSPQTYSFDRIPDTVKTHEMVWIGVLAIVAAIIGAVVPAIRAARTWPVEALRYE